VRPSEAPLQPAQKPAPLRSKRVAPPKPAAVQFAPTLVRRKPNLGTRNMNAYANFLFLILRILLGAALGFVFLACGWFIGTVLSAP
jgi:hypothetical protein